MLTYTPIDQNGINLDEAQRCLKPFGYRIQDGKIERPSEYAESKYGALSTNIETKLRGLNGSTLEESISALLFERLFLEDKVKKPQDIPYDENLIVSGLVDSFTMLEAIVGIDETYGFITPPTDIGVGIFTSINNMAMYVREKWGVPGIVAPREQQTPQATPEPPK